MKQGESYRNLAEAVFSEEDLLKLLGIEKGVLDDLRRERGFPFVRLTSRSRVYLADEILEWLKNQDRR